MVYTPDGRRVDFWTLPFLSTTERPMELLELNTIFMLESCTNLLHFAKSVWKGKTTTLALELLVVERVGVTAWDVEAMGVGGEE